MQTVVSLLEPQEAATVGLSEQPRVCADLGLTFLNHPIRDMHLPEPFAFATFAKDIAHSIRGSDHVAVHCHASIGRSGMLTCAVLGHFGYTSDTALAHVTHKRGVTVPDTAEQTAFIHRIMSRPA